MLGISKERVAELPMAKFPGRIILVDNASDARAAVKYLMKQSVLGFDTETRPCFRKGRPNKVALLQLSTYEECFLFRLNKTGFTEEIKHLFEDESVKKVGLSIKDDIHQLHALGDFEAANMVELQSYVKEFDIADNSLQKVYAIIFSRRISKGQRLTNWEAETLTDAQKEYASLDAYACLEIFTTLEKGEFDPATKSDLEIAEPDKEIITTDNKQR